MEFAYALHMGFQIYRTDELYNLIKRIEFNSPNTCEAHIQIYRKKGFLRKKLVAYKTSAMVSIPVNRVQEDYLNRAGEVFPMSTEELNDAFLKGEVIDFKALDFSNIISLHQELKFTLKPVPIPIIMVYNNRRKELVNQTLKTLERAIKTPYKLFQEEDRVGTPNYIKIRNKLIKSIPYDWEMVVCCDDDLFFSEGWLKLMIKALRDNPDVWLVGGTTWYHHKTDEKREGITISREILSGTCWLFSRETWEKCGPFVENEHKTKEFCDRITEQGGKLAFLNDRTKVVHCGIGSLINKRNRGEVGKNYIKSLADQVGAITI